MITALALMSIFKSPTIPLSEICERYLALSYPEALRLAGRGDLPIPTFRLTKSQRAPIMVSCEALGAHIDRVEAEARELWQRGQV
ncbi:MAG: pyocin activator PrtN family protein [Vitreoscilla sp.]